MISTPSVIDALNRLPETKGAVVILSGGMDSTIAMRLVVEKYGIHDVAALSFRYGQRQSYELECAKRSTMRLRVRHEIAEIPFLQYCAMGVSANVDKSIQMPTVQDVLGDPTPKTYVPFRNLNFLAHAASYAEKTKFHSIICGVQSNDEYGFFDTTQRFIDKVNDVLSEHRTIRIKIIAPFSNLTKTDEIKLLLELDKNVDLLHDTITCYNPQWTITGTKRILLSCGTCPSCSERLKAFKNMNLTDPLPYV